MNLLPSPEQQEIVSTVAAFLAKQFPISRIREIRAHPSTHDPATWTHCAELGWFGLGLAEEHGGVGYGLIEEALLFREIGRHLAPGPFLACTLGARVAASAGREELAAQILSGHAVVGWAEPRDPQAIRSGRVSGDFDLLDAPEASYVLAVTPAGAALVAAEDLTDIEVLECLDPALRLGRVHLDAVAPVAHVGVDIESIFVRGLVLVAAMSVGVAEATRDAAAEYAKARVQFGKPIGVHQAIKHRCADMAMRAEAASAQMAFAALSVDEVRSDAAFQSASAKAVAANASIRNAGDNIQIHGGMGYTFEHDAQLYLKRAHVLDWTLGDVRSQLARLIALPAAQ